MIAIELQEHEAVHLYELLRSFLNDELLDGNADAGELPNDIFTKKYCKSYDMICKILEPCVFAEHEHEEEDFSELDEELNDPDLDNFDWEEVDDDDFDDDEAEEE